MAVEVAILTFCVCQVTYLWHGLDRPHA